MHLARCMTHRASPVAVANASAGFGGTDSKRSRRSPREFGLTPTHRQTVAFWRKCDSGLAERSRHEARRSLRASGVRAVFARHHARGLGVRLDKSAIDSNLVRAGLAGLPYVQRRCRQMR